MREKFISNFLWQYAERIGAQGVQIVVTIILARLLSPSDYGTVAIINIFIGLLSVFANCGFGVSLIQKKDADDVDFSSVFYVQMVLCIFLYAGLFLSASKIATFYNVPEMKKMIQVLGVSLIISGVKNVQTSYVSRNMQFKRFFFATLGGTICAAVIGIIMAIKGYGVWALIAQSLANNTIDTIILWVSVKWRPIKAFSFTRVKSLFSYSWKLLASTILDSVYGNLHTLIIGKVYSSEELAQYNRGQSWPEIITSNINASINSVLFPTMAAVQDNRETVKAMMRRAIKTSTYIMAPIMMGLVVVGKPLVRLLLTEKWIFCVPYQTIFCITYMFYPIHTANLNAIKAMGRSDIFLKLEIIKKIVGLIVLAITAPISVMAMGYSLLFTSFAGQIINSWPNKKLLNYGYWEQLKDILPGILLAVAMSVCIYPIQWLGLPDIVILCIQVPLGAIIYITGSVLFKLDSMQYLCGIVKPVLLRVCQKK